MSTIVRTFASNLAILLFIYYFQLQINETVVDILLISTQVAPFMAIIVLNMFFVEEMNGFDFTPKVNVNQNSKYVLNMIVMNG